MRFTELFEGAYEDGFSDGMRGQEDRRASSKYGPETNTYHKGYMDGLKKKKEKEQEAQKTAAAEREKYASMSQEDLEAEKDRLENLRSKIGKEMKQARGSGFSPNSDFYKKQTEIYKKYGVNPNQLASEYRKISDELDRRGMKESATAGATSAGNVAAVANPTAANAKIKRDKNGVPVAPQKKNKDGTATNALNLKKNLFGGEAVKR